MISKEQKASGTFVRYGEVNEQQDYNVFSIRTFTTACTSYSMPQTSVSLGISRKFLNVLFCSVYKSQEASSSSKEQFWIAFCCSNSWNTFIYSKITVNDEILEARNIHREEKTHNENVNIT